MTISPFAPYFTSQTTFACTAEGEEKHSEDRFHAESFFEDQTFLSLSWSDETCYDYPEGLQAGLQRSFKQQLEASIP